MKANRIHKTLLIAFISFFMLHHTYSLQIDIPRDLLAFYEQMSFLDTFLFNPAVSINESELSVNNSSGISQPFDGLFFILSELRIKGNMGLE